MNQFREIIDLLRDLSSSRGFTLTVSAFAGGVSRMVIRSLKGTSAGSFWQLLGILFVATVVGFITGNLADHYFTARPDITVAVSFGAGYLWKKLLDWLDTVNVSTLIRELRRKQK